MRARLCVCVLRHYPTVAEFGHMQHTRRHTTTHKRKQNNNNTIKKKVSMLF